MNRHQRRKKAIYTKSMLSLYAAIAIALHNTHGFGKKRITRLFENSVKQFELLQSGHITISEMVDICKGFKVDIAKGDLT